MASAVVRYACALYRNIKRGSDQVRMVLADHSHHRRTWNLRLQQWKTQLQEMHFRPAQRLWARAQTCA